MANNKLLLGSDYDGTFRRRNAYPEPEDVEAVQEFRRRGNVFGIVTGRTPAEMCWTLDQFADVCDFLLCSTGGVCLFPDKSIAFTSEIPATDLPELDRICRECGSVHTHSDAMSLSGFATIEELYLAYPGELEGNRFHVNGYVDSFAHCCAIKREGMKHIRGFTQFTSYFNGSDDCVRTIEAIEAAFPGKYKCHYLGNGFDMTPAGVSKTEGIARVAAHFGIERENIYTAGDGWNDVDMLKSYHGIAMSGTGQGIMDSAEWVYDSVGEAVYGCILPREERREKSKENR